MYTPSKLSTGLVLLGFLVYFNLSTLSFITSTSPLFSQEVGNGHVFYEPDNTPRNAFVRGDANADGIVSFADIYSILRFLYISPAPPKCKDAGDFNDSGDLENSDIINLLSFIFYGSGFPKHPYPNPGYDLTDDALDCSTPSPLAIGNHQAARAIEDHHKKLEKIQQDKIDNIFNLGCDGLNELGQDLDFVRFLDRTLDVFPGQENIEIKVLLRNELPVDGLTLSFFADPKLLRFERVTFENTILSVHKPDWILKANSRIDEGYFSFSAFMEYTAPFEGNTIPSGCDAPVANLHFSITKDAQPGDKFYLQMKTIPGITENHPSVVNEFSILGNSHLPMIDRKGTAVYVHEEGKFFVRGDVTRDHTVDISDTVKLLKYLFLSEPIQCEKPLDVNDDSNIDITDPIHLAQYLYLGGQAPKAPFPYLGIDRTRDQLSNCTVD